MKSAIRQSIILNICTETHRTSIETMVACFYISIPAPDE